MEKKKEAKMASATRHVRAIALKTRGQCCTAVLLETFLREREESACIHEGAYFKLSFILKDKETHFR